MKSTFFRGGLSTLLLGCSNLALAHSESLTTVSHGAEHLFVAAIVFILVAVVIALRTEFRSHLE